MLSLTTLKKVGENALNAALVVFVGALSGDAANLFQLDWPQIGAAVLGAAVLSAAQGLLVATSHRGGKGNPSLVKEED